MADKSASSLRGVLTLSGVPTQLVTLPLHVPRFGAEQCRIVLLFTRQIALTSFPRRASITWMTNQTHGLRSLIDLYLLRCEVEGKSPRTVGAYGETLRRFQRLLEESPVIVVRQKNRKA